MVAARPRSDDSERGQASPEYVGLVLVVAVLLAGSVAIAGPAFPGGGLARAIAEKLLCAVESSASCGSGEISEPSPLVASYGPELAAMVERNAPDVFFE